MVTEANLGEYYLNEWMMFLEFKRVRYQESEGGGYRNEGFKRHRAAECGNRETSSTGPLLDEAVGAGQ